MGLGGILAAVLSGFLIGGAARWVVPGPDPMPFWLTVLIGLAGSVVGGAIGIALYGTGGITSTRGHVFVTVMIEILAVLHTGESHDQLRAVIEDFVWRLTGKETVYQMIALADEIHRRGGTPLDPLAYKRQYLERLADVIGGRLQELREGRCPPDKYLVPGARSMLAGHGQPLRDPPQARPGRNGHGLPGAAQGRRRLEVRRPASEWTA